MSHSRVRNRHYPDDDTPATGRENCPHPLKAAYGSRAAAKRARKRFDKSRGDRLSAYLCSCLNWHLGRLPDKVKQGAHDRWRRA